MQEINNWLNFKFIFENGADVVAIVSTVFILIKAFVDYLGAGCYADYYKMPSKNFEKNYLKSFIGGVLLFLSICILPILMLELSNNIVSILDSIESKKKYLQIGSFLFVNILVYVLTINELQLKSNISKKLTPISKKLTPISKKLTAISKKIPTNSRYILFCLFISIFFTLIISLNYEPEQFFKVPASILISIYVLCGFYLSVRHQKFNPHNVKEYEIYKKTSYKDNNDDDDDYIVIQDYGDNILSVKVYVSESDKDTLNINLDHFYYEDKKDKEFMYKRYENVYRWKDGVNIDMKVDDKVLSSKKQQ
ncbi:hypothetical protein [Ezakiella coagulans]|uniref:hypothetical protein n=1 Tax=Ezakiella coagulans TaxID=46507 RepID=UPI002014C661|nr:hypothetical protein [Ezakiella coagulans]UQK61358.1 hypothetical protein M1R54_03425 [Ezakiella coagulans]